MKNPITSTLSKLVKNGMLKRVGFGLYAHPGQVSGIEPSIEEKMLQIMKQSKKPGFTSADFLDIGKRAQNTAILRKFVKNGTLIRLESGRYILPARLSEVEPQLKVKIIKYAEACEPSVFAIKDIKIPEIDKRQLVYAVRKLTDDGILTRITIGTYVLASRMPETK
jgi:predicted transcriptional regulator of viral defense system